jgi:hypothetical protein
MAEPVGELEIRIRADLNRLRRDLKKAQTATGSTSKKMTGHFKKVSAAASMIKRNVLGIVAVLGAITVGKMAMMAKEAINLADSLGKTAGKLGISVSALQELQFAANQSGVKVETLNMGLQRFGRRAAEAAAGTGEARDALKQLGIQLRDGEGNLRTTEGLFMDAISALGGVASPLERVRLAFKLFDSEGVAMVNMAGKTEALREEAQKLGLVLSDEVIAKSTETKDTLEALARITSNSLAPALIDLGGRVLVSAASSMAELAGWANRVYVQFANIESLGMSGLEIKRSQVNERVQDFAERARAAAAMGAKGEELMWQGLADEAGAELKEIMAQLQVLKHAREDALKPPEQPAVGSGVSKTVAEMQKGIADRKALEQEVHDHILQLRGEDIRLAQEAADAKLAILNSASDEENEATNSFAQARADIAEALKIEITEIEQDGADEISGIRRGIHQEYLQSIGKEEDAVRLRLKNDIEALKENIDERLYLEKQFKEDRLKLEAIAAAEIDDIREKDLEDDKKANADKMKQWEALNQFVMDGFNDALATMLLDGEITFRALGDAFLREFVKLGVAQATAGIFDIIKGFAGIAGAAGGSGTTFEIVPPGPQDFPSGGDVIRFANGGPVGGGGPILVGERGPELFIPGRSGFVATNMSLNSMASKGGGGNVAVTVINNTGEESSTTERDGPNGDRNIEILIGKAISKNISRGGDVDQAIRNSYGVNRVGRHGI